MDEEEAALHYGAGLSPILSDVPQPRMPTVGTLPWVDQLNYSHQFIYSKQYLAQNLKNGSCYPRCVDEEVIVLSADPTVIFTPPYVLAMLNQKKNEECMNRRMKYLIEYNENLIEDGQNKCNRITPCFSVPEIEPPAEDVVDCIPFPMNSVFNKQPTVDDPSEETEDDNQYPEKTRRSRDSHSIKREQSSAGRSGA